MRARTRAVVLTIYCMHCILHCTRDGNSVLLVASYSGVQAERHPAAIGTFQGYGYDSRSRAVSHVRVAGGQHWTVEITVHPESYKAGLEQHCCTVKMLIVPSDLSLCPYFSLCRLLLISFRIVGLIRSSG